MSLLEQHYLTKIEGHGSLKIDLKESKAKLQIDEGERLFEALLLGRPFTDGPFITSRICGVCPIAHTIASISALENALDIKVSEDTIRLRKILLASQIIQSHTLHLFFLTLPDYIGASSVLDLSKTKPELFKIAMDFKNLGDKISTIIGGRHIHPITPIVGGFSKLPSKKDLEIIKNEIKKHLEPAQKIIELFSKFKYPKISNPTTYMTLVNGTSYEIYQGKIETSENYIFDSENYQKEIIESVKPYSSAKFSSHNNKPFMVGAAARISLHQDYLNKKAKKSLDQSGFEFPTYNVFHNNLAQAIEILHFLEEIMNLCDELINDQSYKLPASPSLESSRGGRQGGQIIDYKLKAGCGVGAIEAPRGILYHYYEIDSQGIIKKCDIIPPTAQNLTNIEKDAEALLKLYKNDDKLNNVCIRELEMLIRAYDPCITCSVH